MDKAFRIVYTVLKSDGTTIVLDRKYAQADQKSDINIISIGLVKFLGLQLYLLEEVEFRGFSIRTADQRKIVLQYFVWLRLSVKKIVRDIRCFVVSELSQTTATRSIEYLSLILRIS